MSNRVNVADRSFARSDELGIFATAFAGSAVNRPQTPQSFAVTPRAGIASPTRRPAQSSTCDRFKPKASASTSTMASLARPWSGGAVTATFERPACSPTMPLRRAPG